MADRPPTVVIFPGASLMEIQQLAADTQLVRCPGCGATMVMIVRPGAYEEFVHADEECPVLVRIEAALARLEAALAAKTN